MRASGILAGFILTLVLSAPWAQSQSASPTVSAPSSIGLLLSYVSHRRDSEDIVTGVEAQRPLVSRYITLLIVKAPSGAHVVATLPDVIVPRKTGFWHVGIEHTCQFTPPSGGLNDTGYITTWDVLYAVPVDKPRVIGLDSSPCDPKTTERVLADDYSPASDAAYLNATAPRECGWLDLRLGGVVPDLISISGHAGDYCEARGGKEGFDMWVQSPDDPIAPFEDWFASDRGTRPSKIKIPFDHVFGPAGHRAWIRAVSPLDPNAGSCDDAPPLEEMREAGWNLEHSHGRWGTEAYVQVNGFCQGAGYPRIAVPRSVTRAAPLPVPWSELEKQLPGISDAYFSPDRSVMLAIQSAPGPASDEMPVTSVALFDFSAGRIGRKLLDLPAGDVVMVEWAEGRFIRNWTDTLTALQTRGLPPVILKPEASSR
jgi:hypothetical protein